MTVHERIEAVLEAKVRPQLAQHHGDILVEGFEDGILKIRLTGRCSGCPSATITTETLVAEEVREAIPEVCDVVLLNGVSESLLEEARAMLRKRPE